MTDYQKYINALRKCAKEHENDRTSTGHIIVFDLCRDTANLLEILEQESTTQERQAESDRFDAAFQDGYNNGYAQARFDYEQEPTTNNDLALIHTEGLDEGIRCAMCTNSMANDRGCDGGCVVNNAMYKKVMDVIESHIAELPSVTPQEPKTGHWIEYSWNDNGLARWGLECDKCHKKYKYGGEIWNNPNYCPNCGAKMVEPQESEEI